jgi:membrane protein DedA with SNARE-associated domain
MVLASHWHCAPSAFGETPLACSIFWAMDATHPRGVVIAPDWSPWDVPTMYIDDHMSRLISAQGYWWVAGIIALESVGLPVPGEITLVAAAAYAGTTHRLDIALVIVAATLGTVAGANLGFLAGQKAGYPLLLRFGRYFGLNETRIKIGQYCFLRFGQWVVFGGRFFALLRTLSAPLAGINRMPWWRFFLASTAGGIAWAVVYGLGAYFLGKKAATLAHSLAIGFGIAGVIVAAAVIVVLRRHESELAAEAERALPGPLHS